MVNRSRHSALLVVSFLILASVSLVGCWSASEDFEDEASGEVTTEATESDWGSNHNDLEKQLADDLFGEWEMIEGDLLFEHLELRPDGTASVVNTSWVDAKLPLSKY